MRPRRATPPPRAAGARQSPSSGEGGHSARIVRRSSSAGSPMRVRDRTPSLSRWKASSDPSAPGLRRQHQPGLASGGDWRGFGWTGNGPPDRPPARCGGLSEGNAAAGCRLMGGGKRTRRQHVGLVARVGDLSDLSPLVSGFRRRRRGRPARHHRAARPCGLARGRCDLALADLSLAHGGHGLRRVGLHRHPPALRLDGGFRRAPRSRARAWAEGHHRPGAQPFLPRPIRSSARAGGAATIPRPTGMSGPTRSPTAARRTTGCRSSAARPGNGMRSGGSITCTTS